MATLSVDDIRNVVLLGHGAVGKTTLADQMLFRAGVGSRAGSVEDGTSVLDFDDAEKQHKYTITSSLCHFPVEGKQVNLIDTPGYPDFIGQAIGALRAVETAVIVVNASSGIEVNTRKVFELAGEEGLGRMIVINKLDHDNVQFEELIEAIHETFGRNCVLMNVPNGLGASFTKVISTLEIPADVPDDMPVDPKQITQYLMDAIVECDEALMVRYLDGEKFSHEEIDHAVEHALAAGTLIPIFCMSAKTGVGIPELMEALVHDALTPADIHRKTDSPNGSALEILPDVNGPLVAQVFKTRIDPFVSRMSFLRIFSGRLTKDAMVQASGHAKPLKIGSLFHVQGSHQEPTDAAGPGDIVAVVKMDDLKVGDTLTDGKHTDIKLPALRFPKPMATLSAEPKSRNDQQKISTALHKIEDEDQTFVTEREAQTHELVIHGMSELHLKIIEERLAKREKVEILTHLPRIPYRETVAGSSDGMYRHKKQSGGAGQFGEVHIRIFPLPHGTDIKEWATSSRFENMREYRYYPENNFAFIDSISGGSIPNQFIPAVEKGVIERMSRGVLAGCPVQDIAVELYFGKYHDVDSNENAFRTAGSMAFKEMFLKAKPVLLEPLVHVEICVPGEKFGDITKDLNSRRGRVDGMDSAGGGMQIIKAMAPLSEITTYARSLSSMTGGQGAFTMEFSHYDIMPPNEQQKVIAAAGKMKEDDE